MINNPVLPGFHPDPSFVRVGKDYYIATSTFEWFPGVLINQSRDLVNWRVVSRPLDRYSQLDMRGNPNSGGVWAPCLSYCEGRFFLIYSDSKNWSNTYKDVHNYLVTADSIDGPWSEPVYLNSSGFDPSLFHDTDGRKWLVNLIWDHRSNRESFAGIVLQEFDADTNCLVGPKETIFSGSKLGLVEGPHLYRVGAFYYLLTAEGGTFTTHAITIARSKQLQGPYEIMPDNPLITSAGNPLLTLQSAGHGSLVENEDGSWLLAHLCRRPMVNGRSILGRETAIQNIVWEDGWPRLCDGKQEPANVFSAPSGIEASPPEPLSLRYEFEKNTLDDCWSSPRVNMYESHISLKDRPGYLRLYGRESITSNFEQTLVARRQQSFWVDASTCLEFDPIDYQQMAGLVAFYNTDAFYYLFVSHAEHSSKCLGLMACEKGKISYLIEKEYPLDAWGKIYLKLSLREARLQFHYSADGESWVPAGGELDGSILTDEHALPCGFTGNFVGMACQDVSGERNHADFEWFDYREYKNNPSDD